MCVVLMTRHPHFMNAHKPVVRILLGGLKSRCRGIAASMYTDIVDVEYEAEDEKHNHCSTLSRATFIFSFENISERLKSRLAALEPMTHVKQIF